MNKVWAALIDTVSIQRYIFASNRLKENLGASYLVANIYRDPLEETAAEIAGASGFCGNWEKNPDLVRIGADPAVQCEIGYIGGGNALLLFTRKELAEQFIAQWSLRLLRENPGLVTAVAVGELDIDDVGKGLGSLFTRLSENKNRYFPVTAPVKFGFTVECPLSGYAADSYVYDDGEGRYVSCVSKAKLDAAEKAQKALADIYSDVLGDKYRFTNELDKLGQDTGESYIAIVHIDGNDIGNRFKNCKTLADRRKLAIEVDRTTKGLFRVMLQELTEKLNGWQKDNSGGFLQLKEDNGRLLLPLLPIVLEGDDVTFVADGRLGVYVAERMLKLMYAKTLCDGIPLAACAGIAITKTKYPFFRGYHLSEQLCAMAKQKARAMNPEASSWLDYHIAYSGVSGTLEKTLEDHFTSADGAVNLHFGPYLVCGGKLYNEARIDYLLDGLKHFGDCEKWPRSKLKEFRTALNTGVKATESFIEEMAVHDRKLYRAPELVVDYSQRGWQGDKTPYFDMLELLEFYPASILKGGGK